MSRTFTESVWYGESASSGFLRGVLGPAGWLYCAASMVRNRLYDSGILRSEEPALPTLGIGNLTVGGTGKTPMAAWAARRLLEQGARPAIVLRGYGADEPLVHERLNPNAVVIADADRVRGVVAARARGADCAILDDAFQHRRIRRREDWLLVSAERWRMERRCLPAGPLREPLGAVERATRVIVTRKSATLDEAHAVAQWFGERWSEIGTAVAYLAPTRIVNALDGAERSLDELRGQEVLAIAAIGAPRPFFEQLRVLGAVVEEAPFRDHHAFTEADVASLVRRAASRSIVLCTLKDAVKLAPRWPRATPALWYVSQGVEVQQGEAELDSSLTTILAARASVLPTAGSAGPHSPAHGHRSSTADQ